MADLNKMTGCGHDASALHMEKDGTFTITEAKTKSEATGIYGFFNSLIEAHRYVHNRRTAAHN